MHGTMQLVAFLQAQNCSNLPGSWRHPSTILDFLTPEYYQRIARTLEDGKIQMAFFDDRLALPDLYTGHHAEAVTAGVRAVKMDPATILMTMGMVTQRLGLGVTYSTTYYEPFHVARLFGTMDLMLKGRAAWNIVTSLTMISVSRLTAAAENMQVPVASGPGPGSVLPASQPIIRAPSEIALSSDSARNPEPSIPVAETSGSDAIAALLNCCCDRRISPAA